MPADAGSLPQHQIHKKETLTYDNLYICLPCPGAVSSVEICKYYVKKKKKTVTNAPGTPKQRPHSSDMLIHLHTVRLMGVPLCFVSVLSCTRITM